MPLGEHLFSASAPQCYNVFCPWCVCPFVGASVNRICLLVKMGATTTERGSSSDKKTYRCLHVQISRPERSGRACNCFQAAMQVVNGYGYRSNGDYVYKGLSLLSGNSLAP